MNIPEHMKKHIKKLYYASSDEFTGDRKQRFQKFKEIFKIYYPWANKNDLRQMTNIILPYETTYEQNIWIKNTHINYKKNIINLFGIIDKDNNTYIDLEEFKNAFKSLDNINNEKLEILFHQADTDNNQKLDIIEFINFISKHNDLRTHLVNILDITNKKIKDNYNKKLSIIFKDFPNSPLRVNWRPSLHNLNTPMVIKDNLLLDSII